MKHRPASVEEAIRIEAYILSEKAGHPPGMEHAFWQEAETIIHSRLAAGIVEPAKAKKPAAPRSAATRRQPAAAKPRRTAAGKSSSKAKAASDLSVPMAEAARATKPAPKRQLAKRAPAPRKAKA